MLGGALPPPPSHSVPSLHHSPLSLVPHQLSSLPLSPFIRPLCPSFPFPLLFYSHHFAFPYYLFSLLFPCPPIILCFPLSTFPSPLSSFLFPCPPVILCFPLSAFPSPLSSFRFPYPSHYSLSSPFNLPLSLFPLPSSSPPFSLVALLAVLYENGYFSTSKLPMDNSSQ